MTLAPVNSSVGRVLVTGDPAAHNHRPGQLRPPIRTGVLASSATVAAPNGGWERRIGVGAQSTSKERSSPKGGPMKALR